MHVLIFDNWIPVSDYISNLTVYNYTSWDWNLAEMHVVFIDIWMTVLDYNTNSTVIILVGIGILSKFMF